MQSQNVEEYKAIREELGRLRNCMTSYVGFVVLGAGPAFGFLADKAADETPHFAMGFAALLLCIISVLILFLLSYKFTSHNRYAGYTKLLTHEQFSGSSLTDKDIFLWEVCLDKLRVSESDPEKQCEFEYWKRIPQFQDLENKVNEAYSDQRGPAAGWHQKGGWGLLLFGGPDISGSWRMPMYESRIFAAINLAFLFFVGYFLKGAVGSPFLPNAIRSAGFWLCVALLVLLFALWAKFVSKLDRQMRGSEKVEAFCCKFLPIRAQLLFELNQNSDLKYKLIGVSVSIVKPIAAQTAVAVGGTSAPIQVP